jgi:hypothetical protein
MRQKLRLNRQQDQRGHSHQDEPADFVKRDSNAECGHK